MAVPTVTTITPASGPSMGGNMVEIIGTGFRLPDPPPASGPAPALVETVLVEFGGVPATKAIPVSATRMFVPVPKYPLVQSNGKPLTSALVAVEVTNIDNSGVPIPGETVSVADAYTYGRPDISAENESDFTRLVRTLLRLLKSEVLPNVVLEIDTDYDEDLNTPQPEHGDLPGIAVHGPEVTENTFYRDWSDREDTALGTGETLIQRRSHTVDLGFDIIGYSDNELEFLNLLALAEQWKDRNQKIYMDCDPDDPGAGQVGYDFIFAVDGQFKAEKQSGTALNSNLKVFRGQVIIQGFEFAGLPGVSNDDGIAVAADVDEDGVVLQDPEQTGDNLPDDLAQSRRGPPPQGTC